MSTIEQVATLDKGVGKVERVTGFEPAVLALHDAVRQARLLATRRLLEDDSRVEPLGELYGEVEYVTALRNNNAGDRQRPEHRLAGSG
jgi:uncharacterized protein (UPF0276 family)